MRAALFKAVGTPLAIGEVPAPDPLPGEVVLRVARCGICGSDLHLTEPGGPTPPAGTIIGHEIAGEVIALGRDVTRLRIGDRVSSLPILGCGNCTACRAGEPTWCATGLHFMTGGYAQYARASANGCLRLPGSLSFDDGALVEPMAVALHALRMAGDLHGISIRVLGAGPIGLGVVYWAHRMGAKRIAVVEDNPQRADMAMRLGSTAILPIAREPDRDAAEDMIPPDIVIECVGRPGLLAQSIDQVRPRGMVISLGVCMVPEPLLAAAAARKEVTLRFPILYSVTDFRQTIDAFDAGGLEPRCMVTATIGLDALPARFEALRHPTLDCKVMIDPWTPQP